VLLICNSILALVFLLIIIVLASSKTTNLSAFTADQYVVPEYERDKDDSFYWLFFFNSLGCILGLLAAHVIVARRTISVCSTDKECSDMFLLLATFYAAFALSKATLTRNQEQPCLC
jgi:hypothetical protein